MRITILAVGRLKASPEKSLIDDYADRFRKTGRGIGFRGLEMIEVESGGGMQAEGARLLSRIPQGARVIRLDESGPQKPSKPFAKQIAKWRDDGLPDLIFLIGGAEGYSKEVRAAVPDTLAFGAQTWPHRLVKVMLTEQLYRAAGMLAGTPYHKP